MTPTDASQSTDEPTLPTTGSDRRIRLIGTSVAVTLAVILALALVTSVWIASATRPAANERRALQQALSPRGALEPIDILLVGVDRSKRGLQRADTMLLVRVDPVRRRMWALSIPRDTNVGSSAPERRRAPACRAALAQASLKTPGRRTDSDGILSSPAHDLANPLSDHRWGNAFDLSHDPTHGVDCPTIAESIRRSRDPRVKYLIFDGRYFSAREGWQWRDYRGPDPHSRHMHVSVYESESEDTAPWPGIMYDVDPTPIADVFSALTGAKAETDVADPGAAALLAHRRTKANSAYGIGGPRLTIDTVERITDLPVHHYVEVDFAAVTAAVDALGGVEVDVASPIDDNKAADASPDKRARKIASGRQVLDGEHALTFVRSRHYWDADFGRVRNQQLFLKAAVERALSPGGLIRLPRVASAVRGHAMSDMSAGQMMILAASFALTDSGHRTTATLVGPWKSPVVLTDRRRSADLIHAMRTGADFAPMPSEVSVTVLNGSGRRGAAREVASLLARVGFRVWRADNARSSSYPRTVVIARDGDEQAAGSVARSLPKATLGRSADYSEKFGTRVLVIVGSE